MIRDRLCKARKASGLKQHEVAKELGIPRISYARYEIGVHEPDFETLIKIVKMFDVSLDYLFGLTDIKKVVSQVENGYSKILHRKYDSIAIGKRLSEIRKEKNISQSEIAELRNVSQATISTQESGKTMLDAETLMWYADFYDVPVDYIICRTDITTCVGQSEATLYTQKSPSPQEQEQAAQEVDNALNAGEVDVPPAMQRAIEQIVRQVLAERDTQS